MHYPGEAENTDESQLHKYAKAQFMSSFRFLSHCRLTLYYTAPHPTLRVQKNKFVQLAWEHG
jgi:hypothetical protein